MPGPEVNVDEASVCESGPAPADAVAGEPAGVGFDDEEEEDEEEDELDA